MKTILTVAALGCIGLAACEQRLSGNSRYDPGPPASQAKPANDNSMPGTQGGFNNDEITGKSRNPYSTTPGTGPMNSNPVATGNVPR